jgi:hypothetical protein
LRFDLIDSGRFSALNAEWHRTLPHIAARNTISPCFGAWHDGECYAVAGWSNPVARALPQRTWLELRRFAVAPDAPRFTASRMLGFMVRWIRLRMSHIERLISYSDSDEHNGTIYKAVDWRQHQLPASGGAWNNRQRWNRTALRKANKIRWEFECRKAGVG